MPDAALIASRNQLRGEYSDLKEAVKRGTPTDQGVVSRHTATVARPDIDTEHTDEDAILQQQIEWLKYKLFLKVREHLN